MTIANLRHLLASAGIVARYNVIKKKAEIRMPTHRGTEENLDNVSLAHVISLVAETGLPTGLVGNFIEVLADENAYNPVAEWIDSAPWDGVDRLPDLFATLTEAPDYPAVLKRILVRKWLLSATAAALKPSGFRCRGVLTLQGPQNLGKTQWVASLVSDPALRDAVVKLDHHLDAYNKDSILGAVAHWICELGELDSSFKKNVARIKGVLTSNFDKIRRPYDRLPAEYPRRTVFAATVNRHDFLVDETGNSRFWVIPLVDINYQHGIDMQQIFAQLAVEYRAGAEWWLTKEEDGLLDDQNQGHRTLSVVAELLMAHLDLSEKRGSRMPAVTPIELLGLIGIDKPTNAQCRECGAFLREHLGPPKRINGLNKWRVATREDEEEASGDEADDPSLREADDPSDQEANDDGEEASTQRRRSFD